MFQGPWFLNKGVRIYYSKEPTKFEPFAYIFQRYLKMDPLNFIFSKGADKKFRVWIPAILGVGLDKSGMSRLLGCG